MPAVAAWHHYWHGLTAAAVLECRFEVLADSLDAPTVTTDERVLLESYFVCSQSALETRLPRCSAGVPARPPGVQLTPASSEVALVQSESSVGGQSS